MSGIIGLISVSAATPGASEVKQTHVIINNSSSRATVLTPTSGKQIRLISYIMDWDDANLSTCSIYFGTGAGIISDITKAIGEFTLQVSETATAQQVFPDGAGPIGIVDDVLSVRNVNATGDNTITITYREE